jgi:hypothetical protein
MGLGHSPSIIVDGLIFHIDPNNSRCYSGSGNTIYNLVNPSIGGTFVGFTANPIDNTETRSLAYNGSTTYQEFYPIEPTRLTVSVWFKATGVPSLNDIYGGVIIGSSPQHYISYGMGYRWTTNTVLIFQTSNGEIISANAPANKIVNAVYTYDGTNAKLYIDGTLASTVPYTTDPSYFGSGNRNLVLGRWGHPGYERYFNGNIYQASLYNRALTASEILQNYNATKKKFYPEENIVSDGLVLHIDPSKNTSYPGTGNTIYDLSGFGNTGTLTNGPVLSSSNSGVIAFDGSNDYVTIGDKLDLGLSNYTFSCWFKLNSITGYQCIFSKSIAWNVDNRYALYISNNKLQSFLQGNQGLTGPDVDITSSVTLATGTWYHVTSVYDRSGTLKLYVNGVLDSSAAISQWQNVNIESSYTFKIGAYATSGNEPTFFTNGNITSFTAYNRALTQQEIQQNYNATKGRFVNALLPVRDGLVLELDAANRASYSGTGNTWYDLSGNNLNGTLFNAPAFSGIGASSSILFNASNQVAALGLNSKIDISESITIGAFIYPTAYNTTGDYGSFIICKAASYYLELGGNGKVRVYFYSLSSEGYHEGVGTVPLNTWSYICVVRNKATSTISMYINGILDRTLSSITGDIRVQQSYAVNLASFQGSGYTFTGRIAVGTIYNRGLSAYEVKQNFDYYRTRYNI